MILLISDLFLTFAPPAQLSQILLLAAVISVKRIVKYVRNVQIVPKLFELSKFVLVNVWVIELIFSKFLPNLKGQGVPCAVIDVVRCFQVFLVWQSEHLVLF